MNTPYERLADVINAHTYIVLGVAAAIFLLAIGGLTMVTMETGDDTYIDKNTPTGAMLAHYSDTYGSDAIMLIFECDDVTDPTILQYIDNLEADIRNEQYVDSVSGIVDMMKQVNGGRVPTSSGEVSAIMQGIPPETLERYLPSVMMTITGITLDPGVSESVQQQVLNSIRTVIAISDPPPGLTVTVSGNPAFEQEMQQEMGSSMGTLILAAMLLMVLAVTFLFSHVRYRLLPVFIVATGVILTFGMMGLFGIPISMTVIGAFPVLIGIGIDYAIQFHTRFDEEMQRGTIPQAVRATVGNSGPAVLIAMVATSLGFIAMFISPVPMVADFGVTCTIGVVSCYLSALIIVPVFGIISKYRPKVRQGRLDDVEACELDWKGCETEPTHEQGTRGSFTEHYNHLLGKVAYTIAKNPVPILLIFALVAVVGYQMDEEVPINADQDTFVPSDMPALLDMEKVTRTMGSTSTVPVVVTGEDVLSIETLQWIDGFTTYELERNDKIIGATSIVTLIRQYNNGVLPVYESQVRDVVGTIPEDTRKRYLNGNMEAVIEFSTVDMEMDIARSMIKNLEKEAAFYQAPPGTTVMVTGTLDMFTNLMDDIARSKTTMVIAGFVLIFGFLLLVYRRSSAITPLIPIVMIVGWNGAIMYLFGLDYSPMTATLGSMTIGVASEYTILIMERCEEELARGLDIYTAIQTAVQKIGMAITVSGMTTVFGFSALILSEFNIISNFGLVTVITVGFSLIGGILAMPAVLSLMYRYSNRNGAQPAAQPSV
ncbi:efflux RND transporter permease subunit [Methanofollis fontis]|uniref:Hydrogenase expression protein HypA n=1 Tax=Methanofollis fontis TaxID=2052832 RepID=A0A483CKS5_9EURY|nr:RND family transporter [Methanofollis fontis]TAJ43339.1 hydrogenase expression protein HypA [Methanofollis fontis]